MPELNRQHIQTMHYAADNVVLPEIEAAIRAHARDRGDACNQAVALVKASRTRANESGTLDAFLREFGLSNAEGIALMCLAEALLRVPDDRTLDALISEKIREGNWGAHQNSSDSKLVNASVWGLMLAGRIVGAESASQAMPAQWLSTLTQRLGEPTVRHATRQAMKILGGQFVLGRDIQSALNRSAKERSLCSFDMLGEGARTSRDAERYFTEYENAIHAVGKCGSGLPLSQNHNVSVKLSALHPRFWESQRSDCLPILQEKILTLAKLAQHYNIGLSLDAEESSRLELTMDVFEWLCAQPSIENWSGLGFVLQAYQKRALQVAKWLGQLASVRKNGFMVRLVKGAYWDTEIKDAQQKGVEDYPVFISKHHTDLSYEACMHTLLACPSIYCQFATHNAITIAQLLTAANGLNRPFELQKLHGMGDLLYTLVREEHPSVQVRTYAPVGQHEDLLPYLVRRLLENGANSSFVNRFLDAKLPISELVVDPIELLSGDAPTDQNRHSNENIPLPRQVFAGGESQWASAHGFDLDARPTAVAFETRRYDPIELTLVDTIDRTNSNSDKVAFSNSPTTGTPIGQYVNATPEAMDLAVMRAHETFATWSATEVTQRAALLNRVALLLEENTLRLTSLIAKEAGRTLNDGIDEVREAVDFCRYYAVQATSLMDSDIDLPSVTGETNRLTYSACGPWLCISPWNFPLAIFIGQIAANLAVGNTVIAKPAPQTPLIAQCACDLFREAGVPDGALNLVLGDGPDVGNRVLPNELIRGVSFTGSHQSALTINRQLASRDGAIVPFIAETGGINCMIVDSTALPEQVIDDVITSAFRSAGQRCSALRVLFIQTDVADKMIGLLAGALQELKVGDPHDLATDVGPVIDEVAKAKIDRYVARLETSATLVAKSPSVDPALSGYFVEPQAWEIGALGELEEEIFGPILHIIRFDAEDLDTIIDDIRRSEFALTMGVHSRLRGLHERFAKEHLVGNLYINRDTVGAVVGSNPFGGHGLSGTGPKAGGPNYLKRLVREHTVTDNVTALGGNTALFNLM